MFCNNCIGDDTDIFNYQFPHQYQLQFIEDIPLIFYYYQFQYNELWNRYYETADRQCYPPNIPEPATILILGFGIVIIKNKKK